MRMLTITLCVLSALASDSLVAADKVTYSDHVQPLLRQKCFGCHNQDKRSGGLDLSSYTAMMQGGSSGEVIAAGDPNGSRLFKLVSHQEEPKMPPSGQKVSDEFLSTLQKWIEGGILDNASSKPVMGKPKVDLAVGSVSNTRPEGAPPMPTRLSMEPVLHTPRKTAITAVATNPWSSLVAISGQKQVVLYDVKNFGFVGLLPFPEGEVHSLRFSRNGKLLIAGGGLPADAGYVVVWDVQTGERIIEIGDQYDTVLAADISSDQAYIALGTSDKLVKIYSTSTGEILHKIKKHTDWIYSMEFSPDSVLLASGDRSGGLFIWEAATGREYLSLTDHKQAVNALSWRLDSNILASASEDGTVKLWEMNDGKAVRSITAHGGGVASVEFARDGRLVTCGRDKQTKLWTQDGKQVRAFEAFADVALEATICDETDRVIAGDWTGAVRVWQAADGKRLAELDSNPLPIQQRLATINTTLGQKQGEYDAAAKAASAAKASSDQLAAALAQAKQQVTSLTQKQTELTQAQQNIQKLVADLNTKQKTLTAQKVKQETAITPLAEGIAKLEVAAKAAPEDAQVKASLTAAKAALDAQQKQVAATVAALTPIPAQIKSQTDSLTKTTAELTKVQADLKAATAKVADLTPKVQAAQKAAADAESNRKAVEGQLNVGKTFQSFWQAEADFATKMNSFSTLQRSQSSRLAAYRSATGERTAAEAALKTLEASLAEMNKSLAALDPQIAAQQAIVAAKSKEAAAAQAAATSAQSMIGKLQTVAKESEKALTANPEDAEAKKVVAQIKSSISAKTTEKAAADAKAAAAKKMVDDATAAVAALTKSKTDLTAKIMAESAKVAPLKQQLQQASEKEAKAKATAEAAQAELAKAKAELDTYRSAGRGAVPSPAG